MPTHHSLRIVVPDEMDYIKRFLVEAGVCSEVIHKELFLTRDELKGVAMAVIASVATRSIHH